VLPQSLSPEFPEFKPGQVLVSLRKLDTIALIDTDDGVVVWAARGPWKAQHDAQFLGNGHLLIFDNLGLAGASRVLEYDPRTQAFPWSYSGENSVTFCTRERGMSQRLPNGNTLIVDSEGGRLFEVTLDKELAWSYDVGSFITTARRYSPDQLLFIEEGEDARR
jgi:hypothetical protein